MRTTYASFGCLLLAPFLFAAADSADPPVAIDTVMTPVTATTLAADAKTEPTFSLGWSTLSGGEIIDAASPNYVMSAAVAPVETGEASSPSYSATVITPGAAAACACPCHGDPFCDGTRSTIQDVVKTVDVAFRGVTPAFDPACPREQTDVNCDGATGVQDVVKEVNVAFRGGDPASEFCDPCAP